MNYKKIILVGFISAFVALLTSIMGVAGTIIGSVISSVLYNMLTEALENPVNKATIKTNFEWDIAYIFPIAVIALIQLLLISALLAEIGLLPDSFLSFYLSLQHFADNNLYRVLGVALLVISAYPLVLKPNHVKKVHGGILAFVGLLFLARGFVDLGNTITDIYDDVFIMFDLPIAIIAFILLVFVIIRILISARNSDKESKRIDHEKNEENFRPQNIHKVHHSKVHEDFDYKDKKHDGVKRHDEFKHSNNVESKAVFKTEVDNREEVMEKVTDIPDKDSHGINESSDNIHFESNDLFDDFK